MEILPTMQRLGPGIEIIKRPPELVIKKKRLVPTREE
jgi:hypothetical protein